MSRGLKSGVLRSIIFTENSYSVVYRGAKMNLSLLDLPDNDSRTGSDSPRFT